MWHLLGTGNIRAGFWLADLREREFVGALGIDGRIILKWVFNK
jgi:hypothetical protein